VILSPSSLLHLEFRDKLSGKQLNIAKERQLVMNIPIAEKAKQGLSLWHFNEGSWSEIHRPE
jgi:hypothetical protein